MGSCEGFKSQTRSTAASLTLRTSADRLDNLLPFHIQKIIFSAININIGGTDANTMLTFRVMPVQHLGQFLPQGWIMVHDIPVTLVSIFKYTQPTDFERAVHVDLKREPGKGASAFGKLFLLLL